MTKIFDTSSRIACGKLLDFESFFFYVFFLLLNFVGIAFVNVIFFNPGFYFVFPEPFQIEFGGEK